MNILLVYPEYPETFWSFKSVLKYISKKAAFPPLGLITVAAILPENWNKQLVDVNIAPLEDQQIAWADYVFIGAMMVQMASVGEGTGSLDMTMDTVATSYEMEADDRTNTLISMITPTMTIVMGGVVAFIALTVVTTIYSMLGAVG